MTSAIRCKVVLTIVAFGMAVFAAPAPAAAFGLMEVLTVGGALAQLRDSEEAPEAPAPVKLPEAPKPPKMPELPALPAGVAASKAPAGAVDSASALSQLQKSVALPKKPDLPAPPKAPELPPPPKAPPAAAEAPPGYFVAVDGKQSGPFQCPKLLEMAHAHVLTPESKVWKAGMPGWRRAGSLADFDPILAAVPPPIEGEPVVMADRPQPVVLPCVPKPPAAKRWWWPF